MNKFTYASLFSGIGGFEQALNKLDGECMMSSEIDKFAEKAYQTLYGHETKGDITKVEAKDVPEHDMLVGGFPCQSFSVAGKRQGFEDVRGTMFFEIARIAAEKRPKSLLLENVKGLVNHDKGKTLNVMIQTLCEIDYIVDFTILNSKYFGVPQNRERIFIVAIRDDLIDQEAWEIKGNSILSKGKKRVQQLEGVKTFNFNWPQQVSVTTRLRDILEDGVDEKYYLDEAKTAKLVKQLEEKTSADAPEYAVKGDLFSRNNPQRQNGFDDTMFTVRSAIPHGVAISEPRMVGHIDLKGHDAIKRVYDPEAIAPTLTTMEGGHRQPKITEEVHSKYRIRKLTPLECFRLQGFSDEDFQKLVDAGISNSQLYKMAGNAVTVNVISAIGEKLLPYIVY